MSRPGASSRGYGSKWHRESRRFLEENPWCEKHRRLGVKKRASHVDHIEPHKGNQKLFWSRSNWQSLCSHCHNSIKQSEEVTGRVRGCRMDGMPADGEHPWNGGDSRAWTETPARPDHIPAPGCPVTIVCGPPGAGKSTYVRKNKARGDLVIDLDEIVEELAGPRLHDSQRRFWINRALRERNKRVRELKDRSEGRAWFIICAGDEVERNWWRLALRADEVVVLDVPADECLGRIKRDYDRSAFRSSKCRAVHRWWREYRNENV